MGSVDCGYKGLGFWQEVFGVQAFANICVSDHLFLNDSGMGRLSWPRIFSSLTVSGDLSTTRSAGCFGETSSCHCTSVLRPDGSALTSSRLFLSLHVEQVLLLLPRKIVVAILLLMLLAFTSLLRQRNHLIHQRSKTSSGQQPGAASLVAIQLSSTA